MVFWEINITLFFWFEYHNSARFTAEEFCLPEWLTALCLHSAIKNKCSHRILPRDSTLNMIIFWFPVNIVITPHLRSPICISPIFRKFPIFQKKGMTPFDMNIYIYIYIYVKQFVPCCAFCAEWGGTFTIHSGKLESYDNRDKNKFRLSRILLPVQTKGKWNKMNKEFKLILVTVVMCSFLDIHAKARCAVLRSQLFLHLSSCLNFTRTTSAVQVLRMRMVRNILRSSWTTPWLSTPLGSKSTILAFSFSFEYPPFLAQGIRQKSQI